MKLMSSFYDWVNLKMSRSIWLSSAHKLHTFVDQLVLRHWVMISRLLQKKIAVTWLAPGIGA